MYVYLNADHEYDQNSVRHESEIQSLALVEAKDQQIASLEDQIDFLRRQLEAEREANSENRRIIVGLTSRIPQLEAPTEPQKQAESAEHRSDRGTPPEPGDVGGQDRGDQERRSW